MKAGKHTLIMASRHRRVAGSRNNQIDMRQSLPAIYLKNDDQGSTESRTVLHAIRTEFCAKYKAKTVECGSSPQDSNAETAQLRTLYRKLRGVIPTLSQRRSKKVTSLDVVLGAIDYIRDLHNMLAETLPANLQQTDTVTRTSSVASSTTTSIKERSPFTELENRPSELTSLTDALSDDDLPLN